MLYDYQGWYPELGPSCYVAPTAAIVGDVVLGAGSSVWFNTVLRGDVSRIRVGNYTNIQDSCMLHVSSHGEGPGYDCLLGDRVTVGHCCLVHACTVEDGALVGMASVVMDGAVVGEGAMLGAGSLLPPGKKIPPGELWLGRPARFHRALSANEQEDFLVTADHYYRLAAAHADSQPTSTFQR